MNILLLTSSLGIGGIERAAQVFAEELNTRKEVSVFFGTKDPNGKRGDFLKQAGIKILDINKQSIESIIDDFEIDVVFGHCFKCGYLKNKVNRKITTVQEVIFIGCYDELADINFTISNALGYKTILKYPDAKIKTLYYPQDTKKWKGFDINTDKLRSKFNIPEKSFVIGRVARAEPSKWDYLFIPSVKRIMNKYKDVHLLLVGAPLLYKIFLFFYRNSITYIANTANDTHLAECYNAMDLFFHTAERGETFGNVIAEAMLFGKPILTHSTEFTKNNGEILEHVDNSQIELVSHGENGFVGNTPAEILKYFSEIYNDKSLYQKMSTINVEKVKSNYSSKIVITKFLETINDIAKKSIDFDTKEILKSRYCSCEKFKKSYSVVYNLKKGVFKIIVLLYLVFRKLLLKIGIKLES